jgi:hypothetical protein
MLTGRQAPSSRRLGPPLSDLGTNREGAWPHVRHAGLGRLEERVGAPSFLLRDRRGSHRAGIAHALAELPLDVAQVGVRQELAECSSEIIGLLGPFRLRQGHRTRHDRLERQKTRIDAARLRVRGMHLREAVDRRLAAERRDAAPELHEKDRDRKDVRCGPDLFAPELLRRHVAWCAEHVLARDTCACCDAEVDDLHLALFVDHHVARRDVAMDDLHPTVRVVERAANLDPDVRPLLGG